MAHATVVTATHSSIPPSLTTLVGRDPDISAILNLLEDDDTRLLTLIGPGGVGKSRLAMAVAQVIEERNAMTVVWVPLAPVRDSRQVLPAIARALDLRSTSGAPTVDLLASLLAEQETLLVVDNFEHVAEAAPDVSQLLARCDTLRMVVTSRTTLYLTGGRDYPVLPLPLPGSDAVSVTEIAANPAVTLFVHRAQSFRPDFSLSERNAFTIAEICARVDGLPLAIEMAAARTRVLHPHGILARLGQRLPLLTENTRDAPSRQRTMRDAIAWSYDLLNADEQRLFRSLAVFTGGFSLAAATAVAGLPEPDALDVLTTLIDSNLLLRDHSRAGEPRFRMLEIIREFGIEQLEAAGEFHAANLAHAEWCASLSHQVWYSFDIRRFESITDDVDNLRASFSWCVQHGELFHALSLCFSLASHWFLLGALNTDAIDSLTEQFRESWPGSDFVAEANAWAAVEMQAPSIEAGSYDGLALGGASWLAHVRRDFPLSLRIARFILERHRASGLTFWLGPAHCYVAIVATDMGDHHLAVQHLNQALPHLRAVGDTIWTPHALYYLGLNHYHLGELDEADAYLRAARSRFQAQQHGWAEAGPLTYLGRIARDRGDLAAALTIHRDALARRHQNGDHYAVASSIRSIGEILFRDGQLEAATRLYAVASRLHGHGLAASTHLQERIERDLARLRAALGLQRFELAWSSGAMMSFNAAVEHATDAALRSTPASRPSDGPSPPVALTPRELEVLQLMAQGLAHPEIAEALFISPRTVSTHATNIYGKLSVNTQAAAIAFAYQHGLVKQSAGDTH